MRLLNLKFSAFGPYARRQEIDFTLLKGRRFFLIHGATGAGKTTILDAICFALYGDSSGSLRDGKTMRSDHAGLDTLTEAELMFALGGKTYRVWRSPEQERAKKRGAGTTVSLADGAFYEIKGTEEKLLASGYSNATAKAEELLGFKSSQFRQVMLLPQGEFRRLLLANSLERQEILQVLFRTELYKQIEENLKEAAKGIRQEREKHAFAYDLLLREMQASSPDELEGRIAAQRRELLEAEENVTRLAAKRRLAQQKLSDGKMLAGKFETLEKARAEQEACQKLLPEVEKHKGLYQKAQRALLLADAEEQEKAAERELVTRQAEWESMELKAAADAKRETAAAAALKKAQEAAAGQESIGRKLMELSSFAAKASELKAAIDKEAKNAAAAEEKRRFKESGEAALAALNESLENSKKKLQALSLSAAKAGQYKANVRELQELQANLTRREEACAQAAKAKLAWEKAAAKLEEAESFYEAKALNARRVQHLFAEGRAAALAKKLRQGEACPVCGSLDHPAPAACQGVIPDEAEVKAALAAVDEAEKARQAWRRQTAESQVACDTADNRLKDIAAVLQDTPWDMEGLAAKLAQTKESLAESLAAEEQAKGLEKKIAVLLEDGRRAAANAERLAGKAQAAEAAWQSALAVRRERQAALPEAYRDLNAMAQEEKTLKERLEGLKRGLEAAQQNWQQANDAQTASQAGLLHMKSLLEDAGRRSREAQEAFAARLGEAGFLKREEYQAAKKSPAYMKNLADRIALFDERIIAAKSALAAAEAAVAGAALPDIEKYAAELAEKEAAYQTAFAGLCRLKDGVLQQSEKLRQLKTLDEKLTALGERYKVAGTLAEVANGTNSYGMTFQRFVLKSLLNDVVDASNLRLKVMSRGRYMLQGTAERARKNAAGGLDLEVFDHYTGFARPIATLSGGETFLASLSLALGLADVVQSYAGGVRLDTILVDEGFGTLDPEALDSALKALVDLQKGGRLVGIISHVPELKERIDARLEVTKGQEGSSAAFVIS